MPLWESTEGLFDVMMKKFGHVDAESHLTMRRIASDVFVSTRARISPTAIIEGPAWIGPQVIIGPDHAHIMPGSIIEDAAYIDRQATVRGSWIGPENLCRSHDRGLALLCLGQWFGKLASWFLHRSHG
jgi:NDP-sugar pyrophosphorylase family protein